MPVKRSTHKRRVKKYVGPGVVHAHSTFNNASVMIADAQGNAVAWLSAGALGSKGSHKPILSAAQMAAEAAAKASMG